MTLNGWFVFGSFDTRSLGVTVAPDDLEQAPAREFQVIPTPGRNGNILVDNQKYPNVERTYWVLIPANFATVYRQLREALLSVSGYARLTDAWNTDEFYEAYVSADLGTTVSRNRDMGKVLVTFSRKPQRFLLSGEEHMTFWTGYTPITNPTPFEARYSARLAFNSSRTPGYVGGLDIFELWPQVENMRYFVTLLKEGVDSLYEGATYVDIDTATRKVTSDGPIQDLTSYIVVAKSPPGTSTRSRCTDFPSLPPLEATKFSIPDSDYFYSNSSYFVPRWYTI